MLLATPGGANLGGGHLEVYSLRFDAPIPRRVAQRGEREAARATQVLRGVPRLNKYVLLETRLSHCCFASTKVETIVL